MLRRNSPRLVRMRAQRVMVKTVRILLSITLWWSLASATARADDAGFIYAYVLHDSHTQDTFYSANVTKPVGYPAPLRPFFQLLLQRDSRTVGGVLPQTVNDNYGLVAGGVQYQPRSNFRVFAQLGASFVFGPPTPSTSYLEHSDFRGGVQYSRDWSDPPGKQAHGIGSFYGELVYYNRYKNSLAYLSAERGVEVGRTAQPFQIFAQLSAAQDTRRLYYNNSITLTGGARYLPFGRLGPTLGLEEAYNTYTSSAQAIAAAGVARSFWSLRPVIAFGASF